MAQPAYLSPRPSAHPVQTRRTVSARRSNLYRPPQSPATPAQRAPERRHTGHAPHYASATTTSTGRKRSRPEQSTRTESRRSIATPQSEMGSTWAIPSLESSAVRSDFASPEPFVNTKYNLAGGLDTPGLVRESCLDGEGVDDYGVGRRRMFSDDARDYTPRSQLQRCPSSNNRSPQQQGWGSFVFSAVGKVWHFGTSAFKGFYAGGGKGYNVGAPAVQEPYPSSDGSMWESIQESRIPSRLSRDATPVPGSFPVDDSDNEAGYDHRPAKRVHVEGGESPWVMVQNPTDDDLHRKRTLHRPPPPPVRPNTSSRRSLVPVSRRTSSYLTSAGSPAVQNSQHPASYVHQGSSSDITPVAKLSPLSPEAQKYLVEKRREERQQDASIRRMNDQLKALLKEGRQALGTKVEVLDDDGEGMDVEDEGYFGDGR
jgi:hypothetical protein